MPYVNLCRAGRSLIGISVTSFREALDGEFPGRVCFPLLPWPDCPLPDVYVFCADESLYHAQPRQWEYYVLRSGCLPPRCVLRGSIPYGSLLRLRPARCSASGIPPAVSAALSDAAFPPEE